MTTPMILVGVAVLISVVLLRSALRQAILRAALEQGVGDKAAANLATAIHMIPKPVHRWSNPALFATISEPLRALGFSVAGRPRGLCDL